MPRAKHRGPARKNTATSKSLIDGSPEGGIHFHTLDRSTLQTGLDGAHRHLFRFPDGSVLVSEDDGRHQHRLHEATQNFMHGGDHSHRVVLPDGTIVMTEIDGWHEHDGQTNSTDLSGVHTHKLRLPDGTTIESTLPGQDWLADGAPGASTLTAPDMPAMAAPAYPEKAGAWPAVISIDRDTEAGTVALRLAYGHTNGPTWSFDVGRGDPPADGPVAFSIHGTRHVKALSGEPVAATYHPTSGGAGDILDAHAQVEFGVQAPFLRELFVKSAVFTGVLRMVPADSGWAASAHTHDIDFAVLKATKLPPVGISGLPESVANVVPEAWQFWKQEGDAAVAARDALRLSGFLDAGNVQIVAGRIAKVVREVSYFAYEPGDDPIAPLGEDIARVLPAVGSVVSPFEKADEWASVIRADPRSIMVLDPPDPEKVSAAELVKSVAGRAGDYLLAHTDTPANRDVFSQAGRLFKLRHPHAADRIFVSSFAPADVSVVEYVDLDSETVAKRAKWAAKVEKYLAGTRIITPRIQKNESEDEQFVYGIVLEPDSIDSQQDTIDKAEIRSAAHTYMQDFGNIGLQHQTFINGKVRILESFVAPMDFTMGDQLVKAGTWLFGVRVLDKDIWKAVKTGLLTGFSIGGTAIREPLAG